MCAAPKGNRYGVDLASFVKPKSYQPKEWAQKFIDYLEHRQGKVWNKQESIKSGDSAGTVFDVPISLPLTIESFCVFANVSMQTFYNYEKAKTYEDYFEITARIRITIESDQLEGAIVGAYNPNIIARKLGLADKTEEVGSKEVVVRVSPRTKKD